MNSYPNWFREFVIAATALLVLTGLLLLPTLLDLKLEWEVPWRLPGGARGHRQFRVEGDVSRLELLEHQIKRHHLGERSGIGYEVRIDRMQDGTGLFIDDDRSVTCSGNRQ